MKKLLILLCFLTIPCYATVYVTYDKKTNEVIDIAPDKAIVMEKGWERVELPGDVQDYNAQIQFAPTYYFFRNGKFVVNMKKVSDSEIAKQKAEADLAQEKKIQEKIRQMAIAELEKEAQAEIKAKVTNTTVGGNAF